MNPVRYLSGFDKDLLTIAADDTSKLKLALSYYLFPVFKRAGIAISFTPRLRFKGKVFDFRIWDSLDHIVLREDFLGEIYKVNLGNDSPVIFDLGAHIGTESVYFKLKYPQAQIFAFEPSSDLFSKLLINTREFSGIKCFPYAIGSHDGTENFYIHPTSQLSSSLYPRVVNQKKIKVVTRSLDSLIKELKISRVDLLKFDVEGAEYEIFKHFSRVKLVKALVGEVHLDLIGTGLENFLKLFLKYKKKIVSLNSQRKLIIFQK